MFCALRHGLATGSLYGILSAMTRSEAISALLAREDKIRAMGATSLYLFGSTARDEAGQSSDLDVFIDYDQTMQFDLIDLITIQHYLEDEIGTKVDLMTRDSIHPALKARIEDSARRVF
jgi:uncharacterized protein